MSAMSNGFADWTGWCSPIRNQGNCGSCTAFGTLGFIEPRFRKKWNDPTNPIDLSEGDLFFCAGGYCTMGSSPERMLEQMKNVGVCTEQCCPYVDLDRPCGYGRCENWWETGKKILSWKCITNIEAMKKELDTNGPVATTMAVHTSFFSYKSGIYHSLPKDDPIEGYHEIACVGYDDSKQAWRIRNSWGENWGEKGYCWIAYGDSEIDIAMYSAEVDGDIPPQPGPTPSPCPLGNMWASISEFFHNLLPWALGRRGRFQVRYVNP